MVSIPYSHLPRASLFSLPPAIRLHALNHARHTRAFSASPTRHIQLVDVVTTLPNLCLTALHTTGLPWYALLPTTALLVRGGLVYYMSALPARRAARIQSHLIPLAAAVTAPLKDPSRGLFTEAGKPNPVPPRLRRTFMPIGYLLSATWQVHVLGKAFGAPKFHWRGLLNFGLLLSFTEAIRRRCGANEGLLTLVLSPFQSVASALDSFVSGPEVASNAQQPTTTDIRGAETGSLQDNGTSNIPIPEVNRDIVPTNLDLLDPSLYTGGFSWCLDLTAPDPTLILPTTLFLVMAGSIVFRPTLGRRDLAPTAPNTPTSASLPKPLLQRYIAPLNTLQRLSLVLTMALGVAALKMPAAILLYFLPSILIGQLQQRWLDWKMPVMPPVAGCRRPLRYRVRKEWSE